MVPTCIRHASCKKCFPKATAERDELDCVAIGNTYVCNWIKVKSKQNFGCFKNKIDETH